MIQFTRVVLANPPQKNWTSSLSVTIVKMMETKNIKTTDNDYFNISQANTRLS